MELSRSRAEEAPTLRSLAAILVGWLVLLTIFIIGSGVALLSGWFHVLEVQAAIPLCVVGGTLVSSIFAVGSATDRLPHGWEFFDGSKYAAENPPGKVFARMFPYLSDCPFLWATVGLVPCAGVEGGFLITVQDMGQSSFSREVLFVP